MVVVEALRRGHRGQVSGERLRGARHGLGGGPEVGAQGVERCHVGVDGVRRGPADAPEVAVDDHQHQLVAAGGELVEGAERAVQAGREPGHRQVGEAPVEHAPELVEQLALARREGPLALARQHRRGPRDGPEAPLDAGDTGTCGLGGQSSSDAGTSTTRARSHSPRLLA